MGRIAHLLEHARRHEPAETIVSHPKSMIGGILLVLIAAVGFIWIWPELQRYMKIKRM